MKPKSFAEALHRPSKRGIRGMKVFFDELPNVLKAGAAILDITKGRRKLVSNARAEVYYT